jgi:mannose-6-phosphate isomerase-like protein (cupin superfamily)
MPTRTTATKSKAPLKATAAAATVTPVLLCPSPKGELWPLSRQDFPDIFVPVSNERSAFDIAIEAAMSIAGSSRVFVAVEEPHRFLASEVLDRYGLLGTIVLDTGSGGTLSAACIVALNALRADADAVLALMPVGHLYGTNGSLRRLTEEARRTAFVAPVADKATGVMIVRAQQLVDLVERTAPDLLSLGREAFAEQTVDPPFLRPGRINVMSSRDIDLVSKDARVVGGDDRQAAALRLDVVAAQEKGQQAALIDCTDTVVHSPHRLTVAMGLDNVVIVDTPDALLVAQRDHLNPDDVARHIANRPERVAHRRVLRPWGAFEGIDRGPRHQVKHITVKPGAALSLQYHHHRAEHWIVVRGTAKVTCGDRTFVLHENESTFIPLGTVHRLENPGKIPLEIIEVQSGSYLGEDDIVRIEDVYGRSDGDKKS